LPRLTTTRWRAEARGQRRQSAQALARAAKASLKGGWGPEGLGTGAFNGGGVLSRA